MNTPTRTRPAASPAVLIVGAIAAAVLVALAFALGVVIGRTAVELYTSELPAVTKLIALTGLIGSAAILLGTAWENANR